MCIRWLRLKSFHCIVQVPSLCFCLICRQIRSTSVKKLPMMVTQVPDELRSRTYRLNKSRCAIRKQGQDAFNIVKQTCRHNTINHKVYTCNTSVVVLLLTTLESCSPQWHARRLTQWQETRAWHWDKNSKSYLKPTWLKGPRTNWIMLRWLEIKNAFAQMG